MVEKDYSVSLYICEEDIMAVKQENEGAASVFDKVKHVTLDKEQTLILIDENSGWSIVLEGREAHDPDIFYGVVQGLDVHKSRTNP